MHQMLCRNADPRIADGDSDLLSLWLGRDHDLAARWSVLESIADQIEQDLPGAVFVGCDRWQIGREGDFDIDALLVELALQTVYGRLNQTLHWNRPQMELNSARFNAAQFLQILNQPLEPIRLAVYLVE